MQQVLDAPLRASSVSQRAAFHRDGYVILDRLDFDADRVRKAVAGRLANGDRVTNAWRRATAVRELACNAEIAATLAHLFGRDMMPFQTLNFDRGTEQPVHTDAMFFDTEPAGFMAGVWVALEDIDDSNGPLVFYPGSHRLARLTPQSVGQAPHRGFLYDTHLTPALLANIERIGLQPRHALLKKGQALIWHANLAHGGAAILDRARTRCSQVTHYMASGMSYCQPIADRSIQITDIRTGKRHGHAAFAERAKEAVRNLIRWAPTS